MNQAMILAAGRGQRLRPLTDSLPKPLLEAGGRPLLQYHLENLVRAGFKKVVINHAWLGGLIEDRFGDGSSSGLKIIYSPEGDRPLETGGGIKKALPLLGTGPFLVVNADVWTDLDFGKLHIDSEKLAHLVLVKNPEHNPDGDFALANGRVLNNGREQVTYSGIGIFRPELFSACTEERFSSIPLIRAAVRRDQVSGELYTGRWSDIGTLERLDQLRKFLNTLNNK